MNVPANSFPLCARVWQGVGYARLNGDGQIMERLRAVLQASAELRTFNFAMMF